MKHNQQSWEDGAYASSKKGKLTPVWDAHKIDEARRNTRMGKCPRWEGRTTRTEA